jgi:hypothetical protein
VVGFDWKFKFIAVLTICEVHLDGAGNRLPASYSLLITHYSFMFSTYSPLYRFTPPTCTLEIQTKQSRLDPWRRSNLKDLRFLLSFDDPRLTSEQQTAITGNRAQLEELYERINTYIEDFLHSSQNPELLSVATVASSPTSTSIATEKISLQSQDLLTHELSLGSLAHSVERSSVKLSAVQLFDLATALEDYRRQFATSVNLVSQNHKVIPLWTSVAAGLILAAGLTTLGIELTQKSQPPTVSTTPATESSLPTTVPPVQDVVPPKVSPESDRPTPNPLLTQPLASAEKLPPPPPVDLPKPPPDIPDPAKFPIPESIASKIKTPTEPPQVGANASNKPNQSQVESTIAVKPETKIAKTPQAQLAPQPKQPNEAETTKTIPVNPQTLATTSADSPVARASQSPIEPQLQEVKVYFQEKWQPPADLKQTLEYRLIIKSDGSIARVIPIGRASEIYLDRTNLPLRGEAFITPSRQAKDSTVRLLLSPDGSIATFSESQLN